MYAISLGDDGAELRPLEPWHAEEFLAHLDRGREFIGQYIPFGSKATDVPSARETLQRYADMRAADTGSLHGLWLEGKLVGGVLFLNFDAEHGNCEVGCWLEPAGTGRGLVTRAMRILIDWAVEERGIHRGVDRRLRERTECERCPAARDDPGRGAAGELPPPGRTPRHGGLVGARARVAGGTRA